MTSTPRTDATEELCLGKMPDPRDETKTVRVIMNGAYAKMRDHARTLERELTAATQPLAVMDYDGAVADLAKYLPDGWVAQDDNGDCAIFDECPYYAVDGIGKFWRPHIAKIGPNLNRILRLPACPDWRSSLRHVVGGKVVVEG